MLLKCAPKHLAEIDEIIPGKVRVTVSGNQLISYQKTEDITA